MTSLARGGQARHASSWQARAQDAVTVTLTLTLTRYVRKTRRYGGSWPLQIGNALFWRREAFAYVCHEEVRLAAVLACISPVSPLHLPCISLYLRCSSPPCSPPRATRRARRST